MKLRPRTLYFPLFFSLALPSAFAQTAPEHAAAPPSVPSGAVKPVVSDVAVSKTSVTDVHLRPLFTTTIRMPDPISSVAVGAPTLFVAEHSDQEPRLVYVKPMTGKPAESNLVVTMQTGETISMRLSSTGSTDLNEPVDFIVDYRPRQSFFIGSDAPAPAPAPDKTTDQPGPKPAPANSIDSALVRQSNVSTPSWEPVKPLKEKGEKKAPPALNGALGDVREVDGKLIVSYSVLNQSSHWIEVMPPQIEVSSPGSADNLKKKDRKHVVEAEQIVVDDFRVNGRKLAPGQRADGVVTFTRPGFKQSDERILLQLASANSVDKPLLLPVPFVAPGN